MSDESEHDLCGEVKGNGDPCENPVKYADGKCGIHSDITESEQGRPTKFTDERARDAIQAAKEGKSKAGCERAAGIGNGTIDGWLERTHTFENENGLLDSFSQAFRRARARGESKLITDGLRDSDTDAVMARFLLSTSYDYVKTEKREVDASHDQTHNGTHEHSLDDESAELIREALRERRGDSDG